MMNRWYYPALALLVGLCTAQILATGQVYLSNAELYRTLLTIREAGYFPIPNERIIPRLQELRAALLGGLFFTLSTGAGLSLLSLGAAWVWDRLFDRKRSFLILCLLPILLSLVLVNRRGFNPVVSLYFLILPPAVFTATLRWMPPRARQKVWVDRIIHLLPLFLLAMLWTFQIMKQPFLELSLDLRDRLLLSNPVGEKINDFYYDYTPYPTNVFESLEQKVLKTCKLEDMQKQQVQRELEGILLHYDYLNVAQAAMVDLQVKEVGNKLLFIHSGKTILMTPRDAFLSAPISVLRAFSAKTDRYLFFRHFTFFSLLFGFPIALYVLLYTALRPISSLSLNSRPASVIASILCFLVGTTLVLILHLGEGEAIKEENLGQSLDSEKWQTRVEALKVIEAKRIEIADFQGYPRLLRSPHIPERYWLVRALGVSKRPETYQKLLKFLDDPHPNVVRMAFDSLGRRRDARAIGEIKKRIENSNHWYNQRQAYRALRNLGWKQERSK